MADLQDRRSAPSRHSAIAPANLARYFWEAITRLLTSEHPFAVETLRRSQPPVPRDRRGCRFCKQQGTVEDELHMVFNCIDERVQQLRRMFLRNLLDSNEKLRRLLRGLPTGAKIDVLLSRDNTVALIGEYIACLFELCVQVPPLVTAE